MSSVMYHTVKSLWIELLHGVSIKENDMDCANQTIDRCSSTNDLAKALAEKGFPHGTWVSARIQEAGRGRLGRSWTSQEGNLFFSYVARVEARERWSWIPLTVAVAIVKTLEEQFPSLEFKIKWPNDIYILHKGVDAKLGGILCEGASSTRAFVVVGVGLNCKCAPGLHVVGQRTIDLSSCLDGQLVVADDLRVPLIESLNTGFFRLITEGRDWVVREYERLSLYRPGVAVVWGSSNDEGAVLGLGESGELLVRSATGEIHRIFSDEVRVRCL